MIKEDTVIKLDDDKEYYVLDSIMNDNNNFIMIGEIGYLTLDINIHEKLVMLQNELDIFIQLRNGNDSFLHHVLTSLL